MDEADWYYARAGRQEGPTDLLTLRVLIANGQLAASDLVWRDGMADWQPAGRVQGLSDAFGGYEDEGRPPPLAPNRQYPSQPAYAPLTGPHVPPGPGYGSTATPSARQAQNYYAQPISYGHYFGSGRSYASEARTAMIVSIIGIFVFHIILAPIGIVLGTSAKRNMRISGNREGEGMATAAIVIGWIIVGLIGLAILAVVAFMVLAAGM